MSMSHIDLVMFRILDIASLPRLKNKSETEYRRDYLRKNKRRVGIEAVWHSVIINVDDIDLNITKFPNVIGDFKN